MYNHRVIIVILDVRHLHGGNKNKNVNESKQLFPLAVKNGSIIHENPQNKFHLKIEHQQVHPVKRNNVNF